MGVEHVGAVVFHLAGLSVRDAYELLKRSGRVDPTNARVFAVVLASMCVMWLSWFAIGILSPVRLAITPVVHWAGLGAVLIGAVLAVGGMWQLGGVENIDHLVATGLFSKIRHPMYVGFVLWILGWCAFTGGLTIILLAPFGVASVLWWRHLEESELSARYGDDYAQYRATTWF